MRVSNSASNQQNLLEQVLLKYLPLPNTYTYIKLLPLLLNMPQRKWKVVEIMSKKLGKKKKKSGGTQQVLREHPHNIQFYARVRRLGDKKFCWQE